MQGSGWIIVTESWQSATHLGGSSAGFWLDHYGRIMAECYSLRRIQYEVWLDHYDRIITECYSLRRIQCRVLVGSL